MISIKIISGFTFVCFFDSNENMLRLLYKYNMLYLYKKRIATTLAGLALARKFKV